MTHRFRITAAAAVLACLGVNAQAALYKVTVTAQNLAPANSVGVAPLHLGFHSGVFDAFDNGAVATAPIVSVAEGGSGSAWLPAFATADPSATIGTLLPTPAGPLLPGGSAVGSFIVDPLLNPFFTFAAMVIPSNDFFIGNDSATRYRLFDGAGNLILSSISQTASDIWDAGSELFDPAAAAFVGDNDLRTDQNGVVSFNFTELAGFNGFTTGAGYVFDSQLDAGTEIYRISFDVAAVPEPQTLALTLAGLGMVGWIGRRRRPQA